MKTAPRCKAQVSKVRVGCATSSTRRVKSTAARSKRCDDERKQPAGLKNRCQSQRTARDRCLHQKRIKEGERQGCFPDPRPENRQRGRVVEGRQRGARVTRCLQNVQYVRARDKGSSTRLCNLTIRPKHCRIAGVELRAASRRRQNK